MANFILKEVPKIVIVAVIVVIVAYLLLLLPCYCCCYLQQNIPNVKKVIDRHWHILSINENLREDFDKRPFIAYRKNTNLFQLIGGNHIFKNKVVSKNMKRLKKSRNCLQCLCKTEQSLL